MAKTKSPTTDSAKPLVKALHQNGTVKETVKQSADELLVINAVLKQGIPDHAQTGDVAQALENTEAIEEKIQTSAEDLAKVNKLLEHEIDERIDLERELLATKAALVREKAKA
jgi:C4-dicarboxylate-specific signal transduction histidine kinase